MIPNPNPYEVITPYLELLNTADFSSDERLQLVTRFAQSGIQMNLEEWIEVVSEIDRLNPTQISEPTNGTDGEKDV